MTPTRRTFLGPSGAFVVGLWLGGCLITPGADGDEGRGESEVTNASSDGDPDHEAADDEGCVDRLPERSPLAEPLPTLVEADNREAFAEERNLNYRNGEVEVLIELEPHGERPDEYISEVSTEFDVMIIAWVEIDVLVELAQEENVRQVRPEPPAHPHESDSQ